MRRILTLTLLIGSAALAGAPTAAAQSLSGSRPTVRRAYDVARQNGLPFYQSLRQIHEAAGKGVLVPLNGARGYRVVGATAPYVLPLTRRFVEALAERHLAACGEPLVVTSGTRPTTMRLANSVEHSVHPTGMAVDIRKPTNPSCLRWLRDSLLITEGWGTLDVTEEYTPPHFHVVVFPRRVSTE